MKISDLIYDTVSGGSIAQRMNLPAENISGTNHKGLRDLRGEESSECLGYCYAMILAQQFNYFLQRSESNIDFTFSEHDSDEIIKVLSISAIGYDKLHFLDGDWIYISYFFERCSADIVHIAEVIRSSQAQRTDWHMALVHKQESVPGTEKEIQAKYIKIIDEHIELIADALERVKDEVSLFTRDQRR